MRIPRSAIRSGPRVPPLPQGLSTSCYRLRMRLVAFSAILIIASAAQAFAWGSEGHRIVAEIAEQYLEPGPARQVRDLLAIENAATLADVSNWADQIRGQRRDTAPWHFVDIPIGAAVYDPARDCPHGDCVVAKIDHFVATLADPGLPPRNRLEALKFIVHFVGDLHQPLHASDNDDRGGNEIKVKFLGHRTNLHAVWDTGILAPAVQGDERGYALKLAGTIAPAELAAWRGGSAADWANERHSIAARFIYGELPHQPGLLPANYGDAALSTIDQQLECAGVRLAAILNQALR